MTSFYGSILGYGSKLTVDADFDIVVDEGYEGGSHYFGRVEMNVHKPIYIHVLGAFIGGRFSGKVPRGVGPDSTRSRESKKEFYTRTVAGVYTPWPRQCNFFVCVDKMKTQVSPILHNPGKYVFPFRFDLKSIESSPSWEFKNSRGEARFENRIYIFIGTAMMGTYYSPGVPVQLPNYVRFNERYRLPVTKNFTLKKGHQDLAEYSLGLETQVFPFGVPITFKVEKSENFPEVRAREVSVSLVRNIAVEVEGRAKFNGVYVRRELKRILLERKILASKTFRTDEDVYEGSFIFPEGPPHITQAPLECGYKVEMSVNLFGQMTTLKGSIPIGTVADHETEKVLSPDEQEKLEKTMFPFPLPSIPTFTGMFGSDFGSEASFPPSYSGLSSRTMSYETLPPAYSDIDSLSDRMSVLGFGGGRLSP